MRMALSQIIVLPKPETRPLAPPSGPISPNPSPSERSISLLLTQQKINNLFWPDDENRLEQGFAAHIVQCRQQYCSALLSLNWPPVRFNNVEQYC